MICFLGARFPRDQYPLKPGIRLKANAYYSYFYPFGFTWLAHSSLMVFQDGLPSWTTPIKRRKPFVQLVLQWSTMYHIYSDCIFSLTIVHPLFTISVTSPSLCVLSQAFVFLVLWSHLETTVALPGSQWEGGPSRHRLPLWGRSSPWINCSLRWNWDPWDTPRCETETDSDRHRQTETDWELETQDKINQFTLSPTVQKLLLEQGSPAGVLIGPTILPVGICGNRSLIFLKSSIGNMKLIREFGDYPMVTGCCFLVTTR